MKFGIDSEAPLEYDGPEIVKCKGSVVQNTNVQNFNYLIGHIGLINSDKYCKYFFYLTVNGTCLRG